MVSVNWHPALDEHGTYTAEHYLTYTTECLLEEGYTDESDLPKMIAIRHMGLSDFAYEVVIDSVTDL